jgi:hypothetical protein
VTAATSPRPTTTPTTAPGLSPAPASATERWRRVPLRWRIVLVVLAALAGLELVSSYVGGLAGSGSGGASGPSSSYDSSAAGTEAMAQLLTDRGHRVDRLTTPLGQAALPAGSTVFVLDPTSWTASDTDALERALSQGDRVVLGGSPPGDGVLRALLDVTTAPRWRSVAAGTTHPVVDLPEVAGVQTVIATGSGTYVVGSSGSGDPVPLLRGPGGVLALAAQGRGTVVLLGSSSPIENGALGRADDAALALDLVPPRSPVVFDEYDHGFGRPGDGLAGLPAKWRWGLGFILLAIVVWVLSAARRFGPPDRPGRITVPPRVQYVDAMASLHSTRSTDHLIEAAAAVRGEARRRLSRRLGLPPDAPDDVLADRLSRAGDTASLPPETADAILRPPTTADDLVAVGRAMAELDREGRNR